MELSKLFATWWSGNLYHKEQLDALLNSTDVKNFAWILHDKCPKDDNPNELKKPHYHYVIQLTRQQRGSWFKQFESEDMGTVFRQPVKDPKGAHDYLIHDTEKARKLGKYLYPESERTSTITNFDIEDKKEDENLAHYFDLLRLVDGEITWKHFIKINPKRLHMISNMKNACILLYKEKHSHVQADFDNDVIKDGMRSSRAIDPDDLNRGMRPLTPEEEKNMPF